jgi:hypothetical protein
VTGLIRDHSKRLLYCGIARNTDAVGVASFSAAGSYRASKFGPTKLAMNHFLMNLTYRGIASFRTHHNDESNICWYEECRLLWCYAVWLLYVPTFRKNVSSPSSGWRESTSWEQRLQQLATANVVPRVPILFILIMETRRSSETSVLTRATRRHIPEGEILHSHRREILSCYITLMDQPE